MKEILAFIRMDKVSKTKEALTEAGIPGFTCRKVMGRGKGISQDVLIAFQDGLPMDAMGEHLTEAGRLIPKRSFTLMVQDEDVDKIVKVIMDVNNTGKPGDGKIFVLPLTEAFRVRDGAKQTDSDSY